MRYANPTGVPEKYAVWEYAAKIGLFEITAILLGCVAILLALGGLVAFFNLRLLAKKSAQSEAKQVAQEVAEKSANTYLQTEIPALIAVYIELAQNAATDEQAN